jgi:hypothetical protein
LYYSRDYYNRANFSHDSYNKKHRRKKIIRRIALSLCLGWFVLCAALIFQWIDLEPEEYGEAGAVSDASEAPAVTEQPAVQLAAIDIPILMPNLDFLGKPEPQRVNHILEQYQKDETRSCVIEFFAGVCGSREIAEIILTNAALFEISPALAFALSWEESRFDPKAVNTANRNGSVDRGLFQLNNRSFPHMAQADFFNPEVNANNALKYLRSCMKTGGNEIGALAVYNAGIGRVNRNGAPWVTLEYISRIEENCERIESHFLEWESCFQAKSMQQVRHEVISVEVVKVAHEKHHLPLPKLLFKHKE